MKQSERRKQKKPEFRLKKENKEKEMNLIGPFKKKSIQKAD